MNIESFRRSRAFALVLVLIAIVLAATMAVFFLSSAGRERRGVDLYAKGLQSQYLADMVVSKIVGQINLATKEGTVASPISWASQPGMIRTYKTDGTPSKIYKLYSWNDLVEDGTTFDSSSPAQHPAADWRANAALFTDINQPIKGIFPIVDPASEGLVKGFSIDKTDPVVSGSSAPMPTKWLYVLQDGQIIAPTGGGNSLATFSGSVVPSTENPIIGRIAFWTDDETAKVNINTAGEGAFWDWPKAATYNEMQFAGNPPVGGEFNRTPGHPAMTSLSAVFPELDPGDRWNDISAYRTKMKTLLELTPRIPYSDASSRGGTYPVETPAFNYGPIVGGAQPSKPIPSAPLALKTDRLFALPEEMYFTSTLNGNVRVPSLSLTADMVRQRSFFLTTNSRAPETTLFETPRISLWPVTWPYRTAHAQLPGRQTAPVTEKDPNAASLGDNPWMRAEERLLAFTSVLNRARDGNGDRYFFQRQNSESPTHDYSEIVRNRDLISYLEHLTSLDVPGYGGGLKEKLGASSNDMVLANAFNAIRSLVNQYTFSNDGKMLYSFTPVSFATFTKADGSVQKGYNESGAFCPIPMRIDLGRGEITTVNEFPTLREVGLVFYASERILPTKKSGLDESGNARNFNDPLNWNNLINVSGASGYPSGARTTKMRAVIILDFSSIRGTTRNNLPVFWAKLSSAALRANGLDLGFNGATAQLDFRAIGNSGRKVPSYLLPFFIKNASGSITGFKTMNRGNVDEANYGLISEPIPLSGDDLEFNFSGGPMTIEIFGIKDGDPSKDPTSDSNLRIATYTVDFSTWNGSQKIPLAPRWNYFDMLNSKKTTAGDAKTSECPNPGFKASPVDGIDRKWTAIEIAPTYRTANAGSDPALGGNTTIPAFNTIFSAQTDGSIKYPNNDATNKYIYTGPPTYAFYSSAGELMTSFEQRLRFYPNLTVGTTRVTVPMYAENSGLELNPDGNGGPTNQFDPGGFPATSVYDTVMSVIPDPSSTGQGDLRLATKSTFVSIKSVVDSSVPTKQVLTSEYKNPTRQFHTLGSATNFPSGTGYVPSRIYAVAGKNVFPTGMATTGYESNLGRLGYGTGDGGSVGVLSMLPKNYIPDNGAAGDWSSSPGYSMDGGLVVRPDQDFQSLYPTGYTTGSNFTYTTPFFIQNTSYSDGAHTPSSKGYFSPNRQIPSPITILGDLPSSDSQGWQTLLFSPNPAIGSGHPGLRNPPDHLFLDLFWMPVAEPYPISEEFSTAGKINLNYKIMPFRYITRSTGLYATLKSTWITALDNSLSGAYKSHDTVRSMSNSQTRYEVDASETIRRLDRQVFDSGDIFRSASQLCSIPLVPKGSTAETVESFWQNKLLTSDTAREQPYDHLYSRITTKSNTFTIHWKVQSLRKVQSSSPAIWDEAKDKVASELRGSTMIERYIDSNARNLPDYAKDFSAEPLSRFYKWRTVSESLFQP